MTTFERLFDGLNRALQFPEYFGRNFNALYDCLTDLSWLPSDSYTLFFTDAVFILSQEKPDNVVAFVRLLERACENWNYPVEGGESWDRPAFPFHVVFQASVQEGDHFAESYNRRVYTRVN